MYFYLNTQHLMSFDVFWLEESVIDSSPEESKKGSLLAASC